MTPTPFRNIAAELESLDARINKFLPPQYQHCYTSVPPDSMGSAGLKYGRDGKVAWDQIWTTFCDLALAGGPPHRGKLLEPVSESEVMAAPGRYRDVVAEIRRAVQMTINLPVVEGYLPGWVGIPCESREAAAWLQYAVTAENVSARRRDDILQLPAGPDFRVEKEIKNVVVALTKTLHYWDGHLTAAQQSLAGEIVCEAATPAEAAAAPADYEAALGEVENAVLAAGLPAPPRRYVGWVGVETGREEEAVWLLRAILVQRVPVRREESVLYLPVCARPSEGHATRVAWAFRQSWDLRKASAQRRPAWR